MLIVQMDLGPGELKSFGPDKLRWEAEAAEEEKIRLKQYVSLRSKGRHNYNTLWLAEISKIFSETNELTEPKL
jgi:hypothetical protein